MQLYNVCYDYRTAGNQWSKLFGLIIKAHDVDDAIRQIRERTPPGTQIWSVTPIIRTTGDDDGLDNSGEIE
jgi:hypothetical protein